MCIKILNFGLERAYDINKPLEDQICDSSEVRIKYEPKDPTLDKFLNEIERLCKNGISTKMNINVSHNNYSNGLKVKKQVKRLTKDLDINEAIKLLTKLHATTDKALIEMSDFCKR